LCYVVSNKKTKEAIMARDIEQYCDDYRDACLERFHEKEEVIDEDAFFASAYDEEEEESILSSVLHIRRLAKELEIR
jgi:hypothetical protein